MGKEARGGAVYLSGGALTLVNDTISDNKAVGGVGGAGGNGQTGISPGFPSKARTGGPGGNGGAGGDASGGAIYVASGNLYAVQDAFSNNAAVGGVGGQGGKGGNAGIDHPGGVAGNGGSGGSGTGGAIFVAGGSLTLDLSLFSKNVANGGAGGAGGQGGLGGSAFASSISIGSIIGGTGFSHTAGGVGTPTLPPGPGGTGGTGGTGSSGSDGKGGAIYIATGSLTLIDSTLDSNQALGGKGGVGGTGGHGAIGSYGGLTNSFSGSKFGAFKGVTGGRGGDGGNAGDGSGGGLFVAGGSVSVVGSTFSKDQASGGNGGAGGSGGSGGFLTGGGLSGFSGTGGSSSNLPPAVTGGVGGAGGAGGTGQAGGFYIGGGSLTFLNSTIAANSAAFGNPGAGGAGGAALNTKGDGKAGSSGSSGSSSAGAGSIGGGTVNLDNSTLALNVLTGQGLVAGVVCSGGSVSAVGSIFASNGTTDFSGSIHATNSLFSVAPGAGMLSGTNNLTNVNAELDPKGLQNNGGPTETIALLTQNTPSPALSLGSNPEGLFTDQRGFAPRTGPSGTDGGSIQHDATADTTAPTASLSAPDVTSATASSLNPYTFTITYQDNIAVALATIAGAQVFVSPPAGGPGMLAELVSVSPTGQTDALGDAKNLTATYQIVPPGGAWSAENAGSYSIAIAGAPVADFAGNLLEPQTLGGFTVTFNKPDKLVISTEPPSTVTAGAGFNFVVEVETNAGSLDATFSGNITIGLDPSSTKGVLSGTSSVAVSGGYANFSGVVLQTAGSGFILSASAIGLDSAPSSPITVDPAAADHLLVSEEPVSSVEAGADFSVGITAYDHYGNVDTNFSGLISLALSTNPGAAVLNGTTTLDASSGVANFSGLSIDVAANGYVVQASTTVQNVSNAAANSLSITAVLAYKWIFTTEPPSSIDAGSTFGLVVSAEDQYGNPINSYSGTVVLSLASNPGSDKLQGTISEPTTNGVAAFSGLSLEISDKGYKISAGDSQLASAISTTIDVSALAANHLAIQTQPPASIDAGGTFSIVVQAEDKYNNTAPTYTGLVSLAIFNNPGLATLGGTTSVNAELGVASFTGLWLDKAGKGYTLKATSPTIGNATTLGFDVTAASADKLVFSLEPTSSIIAGSTLVVAVDAVDAYGNVDPSFTGSVQIALASNPAGDTLGGTTSLAASSGVASFLDLSLTKAAEGITLEATATDVGSVVSSQFQVIAASATKLVVITQPPNLLLAGQAFSVVVAAEDSYGNIDPSYSQNVSIALSTNPTGASLSGGSAVMTNGGKATFANLSIDRAGNGYVLQASASPLSVSTNPFGVGSSSSGGGELAEAGVERAAVRVRADLEALGQARARAILQARRERQRRSS